MARKQEPVEPWERQPGESQKAWEAFLVYRNMPHKEETKGQRSVRKVAEKLVKSSTLISRWCTMWDWVNRAAEYDNELQRMDLREKKDSIRKMNQQQVQIGLSLQKKAIKALAALAIEDMSARNILDYLTQGIEIERRSRMDGIEVEATGTKGAKGRMHLMEDEEASGMVQLVRSLSEARRKRGE